MANSNNRSSGKINKQRSSRPTKGPRSDRLRQGERVVRRFVVNQPGSRLGLQPGRFRNTFSGEELEQLRASILLWRRGRVYFQDSEDIMPTCKSADGLSPSPLIASPKHDTCGHWNGSGWYVPECPLAAWRFYGGRRCAPLCQETWSFLGVLEDDGLPFWISLKGTSLRSARQFLSMCYEVARAGKHDMLDCAVTLSPQLITGRTFDYYIVRFGDPKWMSKSDPRHGKLTRLLRRLSNVDIQATFDAEQSDSPVPAIVDSVAEERVA
jgi:hypothetical protein